MSRCGRDSGSSNDEGSPKQHKESNIFTSGNILRVRACSSRTGDEQPIRTTPAVRCFTTQRRVNKCKRPPRRFPSMDDSDSPPPRMSRALARRRRARTRSPQCAAATTAATSGRGAAMGYYERQGWLTLFRTATCYFTAVVFIFITFAFFYQFVRHDRKHHC